MIVHNVCTERSVDGHIWRCMYSENVGLSLCMLAKCRHMLVEIVFNETKLVWFSLHLQHVYNMFSCCIFRI